ncbi:hypothetical protein HEP81_07426 [Streptomyces griseofuscus]|uniref:Uncharacterized protein n=1 Tax=Streptomyces griseofuscus TaxID=146922 RepID=A0A7H1QBH8_9ACTN|nr:hypothetical protein HEP81_07426 [Streptomyces griseofuscus]
MDRVPGRSAPARNPMAPLCRARLSRAITSQVMTCRNDLQQAMKKGLWQPKEYPSDEYQTHPCPTGPDITEFDTWCDRSGCHRSTSLILTADQYDTKRPAVPEGGGPSGPLDRAPVRRRSGPTEPRRRAVSVRSAMKSGPPMGGVRAVNSPGQGNDRRLPSPPWVTSAGAPPPCARAWPRSRSGRARAPPAGRPGPVPPGQHPLKITSTQGSSASPLALRSTDPAVVVPMAVQSHGLEFVLAQAPARAEPP